jgi:hypothetical protein
MPHADGFQRYSYTMASNLNIKFYQKSEEKSIKWLLPYGNFIANI